MESSAFWGRLPQLASFFSSTAAIIFGILGALSIHRPVWKITVFHVIPIPLLFRLDSKTCEKVPKIGIHMIFTPGIIPGLDPQTSA